MDATSGKLGITAALDAEPVARTRTAVSHRTDAESSESPPQLGVWAESSFTGRVKEGVSECLDELQGLVGAAAATHWPAADSALLEPGSQAGVEELCAIGSEALSSLWGEDALPALTVESVSPTWVDCASAEGVWIGGPVISGRQLAGALGILWQEASDAYTTTAGEETLASVALCDNSTSETCLGSEQVAKEQAWLGVQSALIAACLGVSLTPTPMFRSPGPETVVIAEACTRSALAAAAESFPTVRPPWLPVAGSGLEAVLGL